MNWGRNLELSAAAAAQCDGGGGGGGGPNGNAWKCGCNWGCCWCRWAAAKSTWLWYWCHSIADGGSSSACLDCLCGGGKRDVGVVGGVRWLAAIDESLPSVGCRFRALLVSSSSDALQLSTTGMLLLFLLLLLMTLSGKPSVATPASCNEREEGNVTLFICSIRIRHQICMIHRVENAVTQWINC